MSDLPQCYIIDTQNVYETAYSRSEDMFIAHDLVETQGHGIYFHAVSVSENAAFRQTNHFQMAEWSYPVISQALKNLGFIVFSGVTYIDAYLKLTNGDMTPLADGTAIIDFWNGLQDCPDLIDKLGVQDDFHAAFTDEVEKGLNEWLDRNDYEADKDEIAAEIHRLAFDYCLEHGLEMAYVGDAWAIDDIIKDDSNTSIVLCDDNIYRYGDVLRMTTLQDYINNGVYFVNQRSEDSLTSLVLSLPIGNQPKIGDVIKALINGRSDAYKIAMLNKSGVVLALTDTPTILD